MTWMRKSISIWGSSLGRVFNRDRELCVNELTELLMTRPQGHVVRSELALIANMARTLEDKEERKLCMSEYDRILKEVMSLPPALPMETCWIRIWRS